MGEHASDLTGIAFVAAFALILGFTFVRMRLPPIVGYILAGISLGPTGLGLVTDTEAIMFLAELGVIMLLFLVGMELSLMAFKLVLVRATIIVVGQVSVALAITFAFGTLLGWRVEQVVLLAFIVAVSSTAVAIRILEEIGELRTQTGRITVGILIAQDIAVVPMLVLVQAMPIDENGLTNLAVKLVATFVILFGALYYLSRRGKIVLPFTDAVKGNVDLLALGSVAFCFAAAALTGLLGLSAAFGAFLAGLVMANSTIRAEAIEVTLPIQSVLMVVFFLSIGLLIDLNFVRDNIATVVLFVLGVLIAKSIVNVLLLRLVREPWERAVQGGLALSQVGEFSFVLATVGVATGAIDGGGYRLALAVIAMSLLVSPVWMIAMRRVHEVAHRGITDFRHAWREAYTAEVEELDRGWTWLRGRGRAMKAVYWAARRRRSPAAYLRRRGKKSGHADTDPDIAGDGSAGASPALPAAGTASATQTEVPAGPGEDGTPDKGTPDKGTPENAAPLAGVVQAEHIGETRPDAAEPTRQGEATEPAQDGRLDGHPDGAVESASRPTKPPNN